MIDTKTSWLRLEPRDFRDHYNERPFVVSHRLAEHPAFELDAVRALCRRMPRASVKYRAGAIPHDAYFDTSLGDYTKGLSFDEAIDRVEERRAYVAVFNPEKDPQYKPVIEGLLGELAARTEPLEAGMNWYSTYLFISSQDSVTPYHMDREMNFLLQIRGTKTVRLWDPRDSAVMTSADRDRLLGTAEPRPVWSDALEAKAMKFELVPGKGVHHPFIAPHLVHTRSELSISLAITFRTDVSDRWTDAHRFNQLARRLRLTPRDVHQSDLVDVAKSGLVRTVRRARSSTSRMRALLGPR